MYSHRFDHKDTQQHLQERIREAQACHAAQRRILLQLAQALAWLGERLITWSQHLQARQQAWELQGNESIAQRELA